MHGYLLTFCIYAVVLNVLVFSIWFQKALWGGGVGGVGNVLEMKGKKDAGPLNPLEVGSAGRS